MLCVFESVVVGLLLFAQAGGQDVGELRKQKLAAARETYQVHHKLYLAGKSDIETVCIWSQRWMDAAKDASEGKAGPVPHMQAHLERLRDLEKVAEARFDAGKVPVTDPLTVQYYRIEAQIQLELAMPKKKK
jgi:hypothetical protein